MNTFKRHRWKHWHCKHLAAHPSFVIIVQSQHCNVFVSLRVYVTVSNGCTFYFFTFVFVSRTVRAATIRGASASALTDWWIVFSLGRKVFVFDFRFLFLFLFRLSVLSVSVFCFYLSSIECIREYVLEAPMSHFDCSGIIQISEHQ